MRWPWRKRELPAIPPHRPVEVTHFAEPKGSGIEVQEHDSSDVDIQELQSRTGMQRVFDRLTGKFKG